MSMPQDRRNRDNQFLYVSISVLPVILGEMVVIWQVEFSVYSALAGVLWLFCGMGCGLFLWHCHVNKLAQINSRWQQDETHKINAVAAYTSELERLLLTISPILSQQVIASREHTEQEIISLANRFSTMVNGLQQIVDSTGNTLDEQQHYQLDKVIDNSRDLLKPVLESLTHIQQVEHDAIDELKNLSSHVSGLNAIAAEVSDLTAQITLLALSATREASLAGEQGFIIVADRVHKLAENASRIDNRLTLTVNHVATDLEAALKISESSVQIDDSTLSQAEANINRTLLLLTRTLARYRGDVEALRNNAEQIRNEINNVLVALQFQDRVSQILTQVENNLLNLQKTIENIQQQGSSRDSSMLQVDEAVEYIEENYKSVSSKPNNTAENANDLTFF
ncbi:MAG: methyl-accepting chemotaxis protein [Methylobacter sp.]